MLDTEDFIKSLTNYKEHVRETLKENMISISSDTLEDAKNRSPIDIGTMRENSGYFVKEEENKITSFIGFMEFYSVYVHQGTGIFALNGDGRQTPWWWKGTTEKWEGWHLTRGQRPKQFLWDSLVNKISTIPEELGEGV